MIALLLAFFALAWLKCAAEISEKAGICFKDVALLFLPEAAKIAFAAILAINLILFVARISPRDTPR